MGAAITANGDLLPSATASFFLARNDVTVCASGQAGVQGDIQVPEDENIDNLKTLCVSSSVS